jgi:hypothetical protein
VLVANLAAVLVIAIALLVWLRVQQAENERVLKQDMLQRGLLDFPRNVGHPVKRV